MQPQKNYQKYYRKASKQKGKFDLRFPIIKKSLINKGIIETGHDLMKMWRTEQKGIPKKQEISEVFPSLQPNFDAAQSQIKYTWIGHSTAVLTFGKDARFLTDPVFSDRCAPTQLIGPKRFVPPACRVSDLPEIDVVIVSHDHYDHLDQKDLNQLYKKNNNTQFFAGLESKDVFPKNSKIHEMDWTQAREVQIKEKIFKITFVPACHWSRRGITDQCKRLWGGFVIQTPSKKKIFYSGDTAYCEIFKELGQHFGGFDLALLPIGAYQPNDFLKYQHVNPKQAVQIHQDIHSKKSVGVHWGTFPLGKQHFLDPKKKLQEAKKEAKLSNEQFITIKHGDSFTIDYM